MAIYNGAIKVRPCEFINIPEPGILVNITPGDAAFDPTDPAFGIVLKNLSADVIESLIANHIGGGDVVYLTDLNTSTDYVLEIERVNLAPAGLEAIILKNLCTIPPALLPTDISVQIYRGQYSTTTGDTPTIDGYTGAGNSEGYSLYTNGGGTATVLTVNNDLLTLPLNLVPGVLDLQVVKVLELTGVGVEAWAFRVQQ